MSDFKDWAKTPPCGWNSWDCFGAGVNEEQLIANADYMAKHLKQYGWEYIVCDIQWYEPKACSNDYNNFAELCCDEYGRLIPAENRFPSSKGGKGFKPIADYIHSLGLKFGIHIMRGIPRQAVHANLPIKDSEYTARQVAHHFSVCSWNTDMYGMKNCDGAQDYYNSIIKMYADWGVDYIKCDDIAVTEFRKWDNPYSADYEIEMLRNAIDFCGREIVLSLSPGPALRDKAEHLKANANMWRLTGDFWDLWEHLYAMFDKCEEWQEVRSVGSYPDCDMLPIGRISKLCSYHGAQNRMSNFTHDEHYTLMTLWGIFGSPLMIGGNMPENDDFTLSLLNNAEYMNMHRTVKNSRMLSRNEENGKGYIIWDGENENSRFVALFNTDEKPITINTAEKINIFVDGSYDIWQKCTVSENNITVQPHGARLLKLNK
ncbi:glycoside hydrolase family 27 protein [Eubacterium sp.]